MEMNTEWQISTDHFDSAEIVANGNKFMTGNGYLGYRGTLDEFVADDFVGVNLLGLYDQQGDRWRESVNAPNPFYLQIATGDTKDAVSVKTTPIKSHYQWLDLHHGVHHRKTIFKLPSDNELTLASERLISAADDHLLAQKVTVTVKHPIMLTLKTIIDTKVWDINGPHLKTLVPLSLTNGKGYFAETGEGEQLAIGAMTSDLHSAKSIDVTDKVISGGRMWQFLALPGERYSFEKQAVVFTSHDMKPSLFDQTIERHLAMWPDYQTCLLRQREIWLQRWQNCDVQIVGDPVAQKALRYSIYQLQIIAPHQLDISIPARGLSGQTYKGAIFWDTEMFMLPFFLRNDPAVARRLINYRINTLPAAQKKAHDYGYQGAFYAWESQELGQDGTSDYNVTDVFTGRPMRTFFRDKQIHISAAVAYGIWSTYQFTNDLTLLVEGGAEVLIEAAKFYYSYAYWSPMRHQYELLDVLGPDEYHERVNNNAYTNKMAEYTVQVALQAAKIIQENNPIEYQKLVQQTDLETWQSRFQDFMQHLYLPQPDDKGIIPQFDHYFELENVKVADVKERLLNPNEYWGGAYGVASQTQVIKQADVIFMMMLFGADYANEILRKNWEYYEPRTEHGSSLSASVYAIVACQIGKADWAYPYFLKSASVDLTGDSKQFAGGIYIGGTHPAASGGAWMAVVQGFCGLRQVKNHLTVNSQLPKKWKSVSFKVNFRGDWFQAKVTHDSAIIKKVKKALTIKRFQSIL